MTGERGWLTVLEPGPLTTVQDCGRPGVAALGVGASGACDQRSHRLANRLVGNDDDAATLEMTLGGLAVRAESPVTVALTGARCSVTVVAPGGDAPGIAAPHNAVLTLEAGAVLRVGSPQAGLRSYLAVRGGVDVAPVLGSRSRDLLAGLGPEPPAAGDRLPVGPTPGRFPDVEVAPVPDPPGGPVVVRVWPGPRRDWFTESAWDTLLSSAYDVSGDSNRVGLRLDGPELARLRDDELPSEGMLSGALQVPPSGAPVLFLADHPVTGGYPVIGYVDDRDLDRCGQLRPGQTVRFGLAG